VKIESPIFLLLILLMGYSTLFAASTVDLPLINEQQRQIYEKLQNVDTTIPSSEQITPESNLTKDRNETVCFNTTSITIRNMTLLSSEDQNLSIYPYIGQCNGIRALSSLADSLTKQYMDKGYITSRVYLVPQDISDGEVELYTLEGKISHIVSDNAKTAGAFIGLEGETLHLGDLESSIEQVNRLRSNKTTMNLVPANEEGATDIILNSKETLPFFGSFGMNNYGTDATGKLQLYGGFTWENFFGFSDIFSISMNTTDKQQHGRKSFGNTYTYSVPLGKWLWDASLSRFTYSQTIDGLNDSYLSHGESEVYSLGTTYKFFHTRTQNIELNAQMAQKKNLSTIEGAVIDAPTYNLTVGKAGVKYVYQQPTWEMYTLIDYYHGLNPFEPTTDAVLKHDFSKWTLAIGGTKYFDASLPITYQFSGYAQYSNDLLYSVEQIGIGSPYSVRGFHTQSISGNSGWYARNDLTFQTSQTISPYVAYDIGHIRSGEDTAGGTLTSATFGLRAQYRSFALDIYHAIPLSSPDKTFDTDPFIGISASANF
jgi:hemolysin activation/secretion protein